MFRRGRWKPLATLALILILGVLGTYLIFVKARQRTTFVSKVISGYRCRFTVSSDW